MIYIYKDNDIYFVAFVRMAYTDFEGCAVFCLFKIFLEANAITMRLRPDAPAQRHGRQKRNKVQRPSGLILLSVLNQSDYHEPLGPSDGSAMLWI